MKKINLFILIIFFNFNLVFAETNIIIKFKVENEIVTNIDLQKEEKYLISLNKKLANLPNVDLSRLAQKSLLNEKIKKKTLEDYFDLTKDFKTTDKLFVNMYKNLGFNTEDSFNNYLRNQGLDTKFIINKLKIEGLWNKLIYEKFRKQLNIDKAKIKKEISELKDKKTNTKEYSISEILFKLEPGERLEEKYKLILSDIKMNSFETAANIYGLSESSKYGGKVGWVKKFQLVDKIAAKIGNLKIGDISEVFEFPNGYLIIKLNDIRVVENKINIDKETEERFSAEVDRQLNEMSLIFFNKVKQKIIISEL